jgi:hypothetical protein
MKLEVLRFSSEKDSTSGILFDVTGNRKFLCYTLEDQYQTQKVMQETRIPAGEYEIKFRKEGGFHKRYSERYPDIHRGMLHVTNVQAYVRVYDHIAKALDMDENVTITYYDFDIPKRNK